MAVNGINKTIYVNDGGSSYANKLKDATLSASQKTANDRGGMNGMFNPGTTHGSNSVGEIVNAKNTANGVQRWQAWESANTKATAPTGYTGSTGDNGGGSSGGGGGGGGGTSDDIISMIKSLLAEQKAKADEYYKTLYEQQISQIGQQDEANRNQANLNYMRGNRYLNSLYGNGISGQGLSNRVRNNSNWQNNLASIRQNTANNKASALAQYNSGLANNASTLAQGWYNYVLPVYTNRQQWLDNLAYRNM